MSIDALVSAGVTILLFILGGFVAFQTNRIKALEDRVDANRVIIDNVKDGYVRRDDLTAAVNNFERDISEVKSDVKASAQMLVQVLLELGTKPKTRP